MSFAEDLAAAKAARPEPVLIDVSVGESLYQVEVSKLPGTEWASIMASSPPLDISTSRYGYDPSKAALLACQKFGRLLDADGSLVVENDAEGNRIPTDWAGLFAAISGAEVQGIASSWWALNVGDPSGRVDALKKARAVATATS